MSVIKESDLLGSWLLTEWRIDYPNGRPTTWPFGTDAIGLLAYLPDGWMSATMCRRTRSPLSAPSALQADDASKARSYQEYLTYAGRWRLRGSTIEHDVEMSLNPALLNTRQLREARFEGTTLVLSAGETQANGAARLHQILWRRAG